MPAADAEWDAADLGCGPLLLSLRGRLMAMPGRVVKVISLDLGAPEDLPAWCRLTGHHMLHHEPSKNAFWIRARD